ncbi:hypothetical protein BG003_006453 [Podila horticola]|nr:hypothetical protein BG003_006453 [Podila horticola]
MVSSKNSLGLSERQAMFTAVAFYMLTALIMVNVNKWALNKISAPWLLLWSQLLIAVVLLKFTDLVGLLKMPKIQMGVAKQLIPLIAINVIGLGLNTVCLVYVDISFYQIARGLVLPFTVVFTFAILHQPSSRFVIAACTIVFAGFMTGITADINVSLPGVIFGVASSITTSLRAIVIKRSLNSVNGVSMDLVYYNNVLSVVAMLPILVASGEVASVASLYHEVNDQNALKRFLLGIVVTGILGFLVNVAGFLQIAHTSPTTHMVSAAVRGVLQTLLGYFAFKEIITAGRLVGIVLILGGSTVYTYARDKEMRAKDKAKATIPLTLQDIANEDPHTATVDQNDIATVDLKDIATVDPKDIATEKQT